MNKEITRLCPVCKTPAMTAIDVFNCWSTHELAFWNKLPRAVIAKSLGISGPRVTQIIGEVGGTRKKYVQQKL